MGQKMNLVRQSFTDILTMGGRKSTIHPGSNSYNSSYMNRRVVLYGERDYRKDIGTGEDTNLIQAVVNYYGRKFPEAPVELAFNNEVVDNHPMLDLLEMPNPFYSGVVLWMATMVSWNVDGNAYWRKERSDSGRVIGLWYTPHLMMEPKYPVDGSEYIRYYECNSGNRSVERIAPENVVHFRFGLDPHNTRKGMSWMKSLLRELYTDEEAARFASSMLRNMGIVGLVMSPKDDEHSLTPEEAESMKELLYQRTTGDQRGMPIVSEVPIEVVEFGSPSAQMDTSKLREVPESRVASLSGIPAAVLGFLSGMRQTTVGATLSELRELAYESAIIPTQRILSQDLKRQLLGDFVDNLKGWVVQWDRSQVRELQEDETKRWERIVKATVSGVMRLDEGRLEIGLEAGENEKVYLRPMSLVEVRADAVGTFREETTTDQDEGSEDEQGRPAADQSPPEGGGPDG